VRGERPLVQRARSGKRAFGVVRIEGSAVYSEAVLWRRGHRKRHHSISVHGGFGDDFGVTIVDGPMAGILARAVVVIGADGNLTYTESVPAIGFEPSNDAGLDALGASV
jgi:hypothetical protein